MLDKKLMDLFAHIGLRELLAAKTYGKRILDTAGAHWRIMIEDGSDPIAEAIPRNGIAGRIVARNTVSPISTAYMEGTEAFRDAVDVCKEIAAAVRKELNHESQ